MSSNSTSAGTSSLLVSSSSALVSSSSAVPTIVSSVDPSSADASAAPSSTPEPSATPIASSAPSVDPSSSAPVQTSEQQSSTPVQVASSTPLAASSTPVPSSAAAVSSSAANVPTSVITASAVAPSTQIITQIVTPSATASGEIVTPSVIVVTVISTPTPAATVGGHATTSKTASSTETANAGLADPPSLGSSGGLKTGGKTAIAVVVPVVVVALLVLAGIIFWRKRKQRKTAEEARRKEVEEYGFNPNHDPTLPAVGMQSEMAEDQSGYRGWGNTTGSNRKASTALNSGMTYSDSNSNPGGYQSPGSPTAGGSDGHSVDPLMNGRRETLDAEGIGALGAAPLASQNNAGVHRGPSNASSSYSAAGHSDNSGDYPLPANNQHDYYDNNAYYAHNGYDNGYGNGGQPVIRDVSARRNTRIENPSVFPQQGNSGIAQNF